MTQGSKPLGDVSHQGGCLCGQVRFETRGAPSEPVGNCHCRLCQKASGAAFMTWAIFPLENVTWTGEVPKWFSSTDFAARGFCPNCGTPITIHDFAHGTYDVSTVLFDDPDHFRPADDIWLANRRAWVTLDPQLAHYRHSGPEEKETV